MHALAVIFFCTTAVLIVLSIITTGLRCFVKYRMVESKTLGADDWFMLATIVLYIIVHGFYIDSVALTAEDTGFSHAVLVSQNRSGHIIEQN